MIKYIIKMLTFLIPNSDIRKKTRAKLWESYFYCIGFISKYSIKTTLNLKKLEKILEQEEIVFAQVSIPWDDSMYQRPQHLASKIAQKHYFLYIQSYLDKPLFKQNERLIFIDKYLLERISYNNAKKIYLIAPAMEHYFTYKKIMELKEQGYNIIYDYIDEFSDDISGNVSQSLEIFNKLDEVNPALVTVTAKKLYQEVVDKFNCKKIILSPNGVEIDKFQNIDNAIIPEDLRPILLENKPIVGYYGAMAPWLDWDLINEMHQQRPEYNFVYIGCDYLDALKNLVSRDNVYFLGEKKYRELPFYSQHFTCCTIPFMQGEIAKATSPLKLFEYMAAQKPVICTRDLKECYGYDGVLIANSKDDFLKKLDIAINTLSSDTDIRNKLLDAAKKSTWEQRANEILEQIL